MLVLKKIEKKKKICYVLLITAMLGGTFFFVYKNYKLFSSNETIVFDVLEKIDQKSETRTENKAAINKIIDLSIFDNLKFQELKNNHFENVDFKTGKKNPFKPFFDEAIEN